MPLSPLNHQISQKRTAAKAGWTLDMSITNHPLPALQAGTIVDRVHRPKFEQYRWKNGPCFICDYSVLLCRRASSSRDYTRTVFHFFDHRNGRQEIGRRLVVVVIQINPVNNTQRHVVSLSQHVDNRASVSDTPGEIRANKTFVDRQQTSISTGWSSSLSKIRF